MCKDAATKYWRKCDHQGVENESAVTLKARAGSAAALLLLLLAVGERRGGVSTASGATRDLITITKIHTKHSSGRFHKSKMTLF